MFTLYILLIFASAYWIGQEIEETLGTPRLSRDALKTQVRQSVDKLNAVLIISSISMFPVFFLGAIVAGRFVRRHFMEMETMTKRKSQFVAWVAHEMRTPLNAIKGFTDLLVSGSGGALNEQQNDHVREIRRGAGNMRILINDILDLSKIEAGKMELNPAIFRLNSLMEEVTGALKPVAAVKGVDFNISCSPGLSVRADQLRIRQVLLNLASNAMKFSAQGGTISISAGMSYGNICVKVSDTGCGMEPDEALQLFEEFRQNKAGRMAAEGTGLGLAISRKLIEMHGGSIRAKSCPAGGTEIVFILPGIAPGNGETPAMTAVCTKGPVPVSRVAVGTGRN